LISIVVVERDETITIIYSVGVQKEEDFEGIAREAFSPP